MTEDVQKTGETKNDKSEKETVSRRSILRNAGFGVAAVGTVATGSALVAHNASATNVTTRPTTGYQETDHVRQAYALARF